MNDFCHPMNESNSKYKTYCMQKLLRYVRTYLGIPKMVFIFIMRMKINLKC